MEKILPKHKSSGKGLLSRLYKLFLQLYNNNKKKMSKRFGKTHFTKEEGLMADKPMGLHSTAFIRKIQITTTGK